MVEGGKISLSASEPAASGVGHLIFCKDIKDIVQSQVARGREEGGYFFLLFRGGVVGLPEPKPPYTYFCFFSAGFKICR